MEIANTQKKTFSLRYGGGPIDVRSLLIRFSAALQRRKVVILDSDPALCGSVLAASDTKGNFLERLIATPAWHPIYSIESMDGEIWEQLSRDFKKLMARLAWREKLPPLIHAHTEKLRAEVAADPDRVVDSERLARLTVSILSELLFETPLSPTDETLFYEASIQWRKEIAVKGIADPEMKAQFWTRVTELVSKSRFKEGLETYVADPARWVSLFAQPFLISPQINLSDIFVSVFHFLRTDPVNLSSAKEWAEKGDRPRLEGILLESIRLQHPFPILEREMTSDFTSHGRTYPAGTQFFILLDQFKQDSSFQPERWLLPSSENPYASIPFAAGPRMCVGKPIAMELMVELLKAFLLYFPDSSLKFELGHIYSGRDNDKNIGKEEDQYQTRVFLRFLWKSFLIGWRKKRHPRTEALGCPFSKK